MLTGSFLLTIGRTKYLTWGITSLKPDNVDIYLEKIVGNQYVYGNEL